MCHLTSPAAHALDIHIQMPSSTNANVCHTKTFFPEGFNNDKHIIIKIVSILQFIQSAYNITYALLLTVHKAAE